MCAPTAGCCRGRGHRRGPARLARAAGGSLCPFHPGFRLGGRGDVRRAGRGPEPRDDRDRPVPVRPRLRLHPPVLTPSAPAAAHGGLLPGNDEREQTRTQPRAEMDGLEDSAGAAASSATNRPDALKTVLRVRAVRLEVEPVPLPNWAERRPPSWPPRPRQAPRPETPTGPGAAADPGFSGADLANLVNEAAVTAVRAGRTTLVAPTSSAPATASCSAPGTPARWPPTSLPRRRPQAGHALDAACPPTPTRSPGHRAWAPAGPRADRDAARRRPAAVRGRVPRRHPRRPPRRPGRRMPGPRRGLHRRRRRWPPPPPWPPRCPRVRPQRDDRHRRAGRPKAIPPRPARGYSSAPNGWSTRSRRPADQRGNRARDLLTKHREALDQLTAVLIEQETVTGDQVRALAWASSWHGENEQFSSTNRISR